MRAVDSWFVDHARACWLALERAVAPGVDLEQTARIVKLNPRLREQFLSALNSGYFGWKKPIRTVLGGMSMLGEPDLRRWLAMVALSGLLDYEPTPRMFAAVGRARNCELKAWRFGSAYRAMDAFMAGLLAEIDEITGMEMEVCVAQLPASLELSDALLGRGEIAEWVEEDLTPDTREWAEAAADSVAA